MIPNDIYNYIHKLRLEWKRNKQEWDYKSAVSLLVEDGTHYFIVGATFVKIDKYYAILSEDHPDIIYHEEDVDKVYICEYVT